MMTNYRLSKNAIKSLCYIDHRMLYKKLTIFGLLYADHPITVHKNLV